MGSPDLGRCRGEGKQLGKGACDSSGEVRRKHRRHMRIVTAAGEIAGRGLQLQQGGSPLGLSVRPPSLTDATIEDLDPRPAMQMGLSNRTQNSRSLGMIE